MTPAASPRAAVERALPLLQKTDAVFLKKSGCVSCHNNTLTAMTVAAARSAGVRVDDQTARAQLTSIVTFVDAWRERALQGLGIPGDADTISYILLGLAAEQHAPDAATDAMARYLRSRQRPDGHWSIIAHRPPSEASDIQVTAASMRSLQLYGPRADRAGYRKAAESAAAWLSKAQPECNEDRAFQLLGLTWARAGRRAIQTAARALLAEQRPDGGWSQLRSLPSDAYATGQALVALKESGALAPSDPAYTEGCAVSVEHAIRGRLVAREEPRDRAAAVVRHRVSSRPGLVGLRGRHQLGDDGAGGGRARALTGRRPLAPFQFCIAPLDFRLRASDLMVSNADPFPRSHMKGKAVWLLAGILALTVPALAQSSATDALSALLVEVRQLRIVMERAATTTPQVQLLGARLSVQNERLARAERDHDSTKRELEEVSAALAQMAAQIEEIESAAAQETNPERQRGLSMDARAMTSQRAEMSARQLRLRARESELATRFGSEELRWTELNRRLDDVERAINAQSPR